MGDLLFSTKYPESIKLGNTSISKIMAGSVQVWPRSVISLETVDFLVVGGGGGGGYSSSTYPGGGGGGGLVIEGSNQSLSSGSYNLIVGTKGLKSLNSNTGGNGGNSTFPGLAIAGGGGGGGSAGSNKNGLSGGSGGGGAGNGGVGGSATGGLGTYVGGNGSTSTYYPSGGGGGANGAGQNGNTNIGYSGNGSSGKKSSISGTLIGYGGGGGGGSIRVPVNFQTFYGTATDGGGRGGDYLSAGNNGTSNTGGGGGGGGVGFSSGDGADGIIILRYQTGSYGPTSSGGTVTIYGSYTIHTFTSSGSLYLAPPVIDSISPSTPQGVTGGESTSPWVVNLTWVNSTDNVSVAGYEIWRTTTISTNAYSFRGSGTTNSYIDATGAITTTSFFYKVIAYDSVGNKSTISAASPKITVDGSTSTDGTSPTTPTSVTAVLSGSYSVYLTWSSSYDLVGVTNYIIYSSSTVGGTYTQIGSAGGNYTSITVGPLSNGNYYFKMSAKDAANNESELSSPTSLIIISSTPVLNLDNFTTTTIDISWTNASGSNIVQRSNTGTSSWSTKATVTSNYWQDTIFNFGNTYYYRVSADGGSTYSNILTVDTSGPPP